jgi:hypothetical protein
MATQPNTDGLFAPPPEETPFDNIDTTGLESDMEPEKEPNAVTTQVGALAALRNDPDVNPMNIIERLEAAVAKTEEHIRNTQESRLRVEAATKRALTRQSTLRDPEMMMGIPADLQSDIVARTTLESSKKFEENMRVALEEEAIEAMEDLAAAGDYTQGKMIMNRYTPGRMSPSEIWRDHSIKQLLLAQAAEEFRAEDNKEGWFAMTMTGLASLIQPSFFSYLGNVDEGKGGYTRSPFAFLDPGGDVQKQAEAIWKLPASELAEYLPEWKANLRNNATSFGFVNPDKMVELGSMFEQPISDRQASSMNAANAAELLMYVAPGVGIVPYRLAARAVSFPLAGIRAGARKEMANRVNQAFDILVNEGEAAAKAKTGMDADTIIDQMSPTIINPLRSAEGEDLFVTLAGEIGYNQKAINEIIQEWNLVNTERFITEEAVADAFEATVRKVTERHGAEVLDFDKVTIKLADGTNTKRIVATLGRPDGGVWASLQEAMGWAFGRGFGEARAVRLGGDTDVLITPRQEGFGDVMYHGTPVEFTGHLRPSDGGKMGPGVYLTDDADHAATHAGKVDENFYKDSRPNIRPLLVNGSKIFGWKQASRGWLPSEVRAAWKELGLKEPRKWLQDNKPAGVDFIPSKDVIRKLQDELADDGPTGAALNKALEEKGYHGITGDFFGTRETVIFDPANAKPFSARTWAKDQSGGFVLKVEMDVEETAFMTTPLQPPAQGFLAKWWKNPSQTVDRNLFNKATQADQKANRLYTLLDKNLAQAFRDLSGTERDWLIQILAKGQNEAKWFTDEGFSKLAERAMGAPPTERMLKAYHQYRLNNDLEHSLRNMGVYRDKVIRGYESIKFNALGQEFDIDGIINYSPVKVPRNRIYNLTDDLHYVGKKKLSQKKLTDMKNRGYILFRTEEPVRLKDGTEISEFIAKKSDIEFRPLRQEQLPYSPGGHRQYTDRYLVKQARWGEQPDTKQKFLKNPRAWATGPTVKDVRDYAGIMNEARLAAKAGLDAAHLDKVVFKGLGGDVDKGLPYPSGEEFMKAVKDGEIDLDEPFEAVFDRELPSAYSKAGEDVERFIAEEDLKGLSGNMRQTGRMYYSKKGEQLRSTKGGLAPTLDPFEVQNTALFNVARQSVSFGDYKVSAINHWVETYRDHLNIRALPEDQANSNVAIFNNATASDTMDINLRQQMTGQREAIKRILGFETDFDRGVRHWTRSTAEWIVGDSDNAFRKSLSQGVFWLADHNPVSALRGFAFDMKLGMLNVGQFFIQASTAFSALAVNPTHGKFGMFSAMPIWTYFLKKGDEKVLDTWIQRGAHKLAGFEDAADFRAYAKNAYETGFFNLNDTHTLVNDSGPQTTFGSLQGGVHSMREMGRFFFYQAEVFNRLVAHRIAYGEAVEKFGLAARDGFLFKEFVAGRAENYSMNMSNSSKAWWQSGLLSIPTQFWAYNVRMFEALTGKNFTTKQKRRLAMAQVGMAGTGGIPIVAGLAEAMKNLYGVEPDIDTALGTIDRGLADRLIYEMTGADVMVGEKWGTGTWFSDVVKDLFGMSEYNERSFASIMAGATGSIVTSTLAPIYNLTKFYMTHESGAEEINLAGEEWTKLFKQVSTINNGLKAYMVWNYGMYQSTKGNVLATDVPSQDAIFIAAGFRPHELDEVSVVKAYLDNRKESIDEAANQLRVWRQEAFTRPDLLEENAKKANAFVQMLPPDIRREVKKRAHQKVDDSFYTGIMDRMKDVERQEGAVKRFNEGIEE